MLKQLIIPVLNLVNVWL